MSRRFRALGAGLGATAIATLASVASAQPTPIEIPVRNFKPAVSTRGFWVTENGKTLEHVSPSAHLLLSYVKRPLQLVNTDTDENQSDIIGDRWNLDLMVAIGFFDRLELGVAVPATLAQSGDDLRLLDRPAGDELKGAFGDLRVVPKVRLGTTENGVTTFSLAVPFSVPSGSRGNLLGEDGPTFSPTAILSFDAEGVDVGINLGGRFRKNDDIGFSQSQPNIALRDEVFASVGPKIHLVKDHLDLVGDVWFSTIVGKDPDVEEIPVEALGGLRGYFAQGWLADLGAGGGLTRGIGAPAFRVVLGVGYEYVEDPDPDKDGIKYDADKCPLVPEDKDGFQDVDGCPDPDNDKDGILDAKDRCPLDPEDADKFEDEDGCPDPDNDKDGIKDPDDECPNEPEDMDQFQDADGCPDLDNDKDGVLDKSDQCPLEPEDVDTFEDENGCPDPDNDKDGILDKDDKCPLEPEDKDNFQDEDGCPDPDNDGDGILDGKDQCPNEPEVMNGFEDEDGCPDKKKGPVQIEHGKITAPPVFFATNKDVILPQSFPILELVAQTFKENPWVKRVRVEGHTDDKGSDKFNLDLSDRRAKSVMKFLLDAGVEPERLEARGFGETQPIASNKQAAGRAKNRRVEFIIVEPPLPKDDTGTTKSAAPE